MSSLKDQARERRESLMSPDHVPTAMVTDHAEVIVSSWTTQGGRCAQGEKVRLSEVHLTSAVVGGKI